jgi:hypothetical protein
MLNEQAADTGRRSVGMNGDLVRYVCRSKAHMDTSASRSAMVTAGSPVTIHDGGWAYCPAGSQTDHAWEAIEPVTLTDLRLAKAARPREVAPEDSRS